jgi:hypothetical protein
LETRSGKLGFTGAKMHDWQNESEGVHGLYVFETMPAVVRLL